MSYRLPSAECRPRSMSLQDAEKGPRDQASHMGRELGRRRRYGRPSRGSRDLEEEGGRRGRKKEEEGKDIELIRSSEEEEVQEKEKEERKEGRQSQGGESTSSREWELKKVISEAAGGFVLRDRFGPCLEEAEKARGQGQKIAQEGPRLQQQRVRREWDDLRIRDAGGSPSRPQQDLPGFAAMPWTFDSKLSGAPQAPRDESHVVGLGARREDHPASFDGVLPVFPLPQSFRGSGPRSSDAFVDPRPALTRASCRSSRLPHAEAQVHRVDTEWRQLGGQPEARVGTNSRAHAGFTLGDSASAQRAEARSRSEGTSFSPRRRTRQRAWKREGQRKEQDKEQEQGCFPEEGTRGMRREEREVTYELPGEGGEEREAKRWKEIRKRGLPREGERLIRRELRRQRRMQEKDSRGRARGEERRNASVAGALCAVGLQGKLLRMRKKRLKGKAPRMKKDLQRTQRTREAERKDDAGGGRPFKLPKVDLQSAAATAPAEDFSRADPTGTANDLKIVSGIGREVKKNLNATESIGRFGELYSWLETRVDVFMSWLCKTTPTGRVFPLPTSSQVLSQLLPHRTLEVRRTLRSLLFSLNSLNGEGTEGPDKASDFHVTILNGLVEDCERVCAWDICESPPSWEDFFRVKGVDYKGEEVLTAQTMRWANVEPALPAQVGGVPLTQVVEKGCLHYVTHFEEYLLEPEDQVYVKPPRVLVPPDDWANFCTGLLRLGVFSKVHEDEIYKVQGKPLLSGRLQERVLRAARDLETNHELGAIEWHL